MPSRRLITALPVADSALTRKGSGASAVKLNDRNLVAPQILSDGSSQAQIIVNAAI